MPLPGNTGQFSFPSLWLPEPYVPVHWFTWASFSTVGRIDNVSSETESSLPSLLLLCRSWNAWSTESVLEPWRSSGKLDYKQLLCVWEREKVFKSQWQVREKVRERWVGVGANWRVKPLGRCTLTFQEEFDVNQWSLSPWVSLWHFEEGRRRI